MKDKFLHKSAEDLDHRIVIVGGGIADRPLPRSQRLAIIRRKLRQYAKACVALPETRSKLTIRREVLLAYGFDDLIRQAPLILRQLAVLVRDDDIASNKCRDQLRWAIHWLQLYHREQDHLKTPKETYRP